VSYQVDLRYHGQGLQLTVNADLAELKAKGLEAIGAPFDEIHRQLFTFDIDVEHERGKLRARVKGKATMVNAEKVPQETEDPSAAVIASQTVFMDGEDHTANI